VNGRTCPPRDPGALAAAIRELVQDGDRRAALAAAARRSVQEEYDERRVFKRFADLIRDLAARRQAR